MKMFSWILQTIQKTNQYNNLDNNNNNNNNQLEINRHYGQKKKEKYMMVNKAETDISNIKINSM